MILAGALLGLIAASSPASAEPATLQLDPVALPVVAETAPEHGPGAAHLVFPDGLDLVALPAVVVVLDEGVEPPAGAHPLGPTGRSWRVPVVDARAAVALAARLEARPGVQAALPDLVLPRVAHTYDDPEYPGQWYLELLEIETLHALEFGDPDVRVAVIDSGIDLDHPDLEGAWVDPIDTFDGDDDPRPIPGDDHGTAVSGIVGARADNGIGLVGVCPGCTLVPIRMLGEGDGTLGRDVAAFEHAIAADADVINNSWGFIQPMPVPGPLAAVIRRAATETRGGLGSVVIFAAGNDDRVIGDDEMQALPEVLCVSATDRYGLPTAYTNEGATVDVAAPSATVALAAGGGTFTTFGGTSAAAPVVAGLAGWALSADPSLSAAEVRALLVDTAVPSPQVTPDESGHHPIYGYGEVSAIALRDALFPPPEAEEPPGGCGCASSPGSGSLAVLGALLAGLLVRRRRRAGAGPHPR